MKYPLVIFLLFTFLSSHAQQNTILIIADDVSPDYFSFSPDAKDTAITPNINALAANGIRFNRAWATPVCSPTRAGICTGRYPFRTGVGHVIADNSSPQLDTAEMSIAKLLKYYAPLKYNTAHVGKWHLHWMTSQKYLYPNLMGNNFYSGYFNGALTDYYSYKRVTNGILDTVTTYATTQTVNDAIGWLDTMNASKPFFLCLAFNAPHTPFHKPPANLISDTTLTGTAEDISVRPKFYFKAAIEAMDTEIGRLLEYLNVHNLSDSTNVIFIGDNGNETATAQIEDSVKAKGTLYDYGVRVPMVIKGPAVINPDRASDALVSTVDLFATIAELCDFNDWINFIPPNKLPVDSKSLLPLIKNQTETLRNWNFSEEFSTISNPQFGKAIRNNDYHLIRFDNGNEELYNITTDTLEKTNLLTGNLTQADISNYHSLCDTLSALVGTNNCNACDPPVVPDFSANATTGCPGTTVNFTYFPLNLPDSFLWSFPGGTPSTSSLQNPAVTYSNSGKFSVTVTAIRSCGSHSTFKHGYIDINPKPIASITPAGTDSVCPNQPVLLSANTGTALTYQWIKGSANISGATNSTYNAVSAGTYKVKITKTTTGCSNTSAVKSIVNRIVNAVITAQGPTVFCSGTNPLTLTANSGTGLTYQWKKGNTNISGATNQSYVPIVSGNAYKVIVTTTQGCSKTSADIAVTVNALPTATITALGPVTFCAGDSVILQANNGAGLSYQWKKGAANIPSATLQNYTVKTGGTYKVVVTDANSCSRTSAGKLITVNCREEGIRASVSDVQFTAYPNPAHDRLTVSIDVPPSLEGEPGKSMSIILQMKDVSGRIVLSENQTGTTGINNFELDLSELSKGVYMLEVKSANDIWRTRVVVE